MMDIQEIINNKAAAMRKESLSKSDQITVGELICLLENVEDKTIGIRFNFEYLKPDNFISWRGIYAELSIEFSEDGQLDTVEKFLTALKDVVGKTFTGYKGGDFVMSRQTPLWVANYGNCGNTGVYGIKKDSYEVVILTKEYEV